MKCKVCGTKTHKKFCHNCGAEMEGDYFKCRGCGEKYLEEFAYDEDTGYCYWCGRAMHNVNVGRVN